MNNTYRKVMEQQCLSDQARQAIYRKLQRKEEVKTQPFVLRAAIVAACILLMIPVTAYAVKTIFGVSVVEIIKGNTKTGKFGTGYEVDYLFAAVMVSNPLLWMELSELDKVSSERLAGIIFIYRKYREDFREVIPVMDRPDGFSRTGFFICGAQQDYVLLFRELTEENEFPYQLDEVLATNDPEIQKAPVKLSRARSYVFGTVQKTTV